MLRGQVVGYQHHIGGGHYVSVTSGFDYVDFRKFYVRYGQLDVRPTKMGIALRLSEWAQIQRLVEVIHNAYPTTTTTTTTTKVKISVTLHKKVAGALYKVTCTVGAVQVALTVKKSAKAVSHWNDS